MNLANAQRLGDPLEAWTALLMPSMGQTRETFSYEG